MISLTFDTSVLRDYLDPSREYHEHAKYLVQMDNDRICEIRVVSRFTADVPAGELRTKLDDLSICQRPRIPTIAQWDVSKWDADFWPSDEDQAIYKRLFEIIFPGADANNKKHKNRIADIGHLIGHMHSKSDIFVTGDKAILQRANLLLAEFNICVMSPINARQHCSSQK